jgi:hypothetical protein
MQRNDIRQPNALDRYFGDSAPSWQPGENPYKDGTPLRTTIPAFTNCCRTSRWFREQRAKLSKNNETTRAINYCLSRWDAFTRSLDEGRLCMSNNAAERELRAVAVGRRNWTFAGSDDGGRRAAAIYTLIATGKLNHIDRQDWLADVLARLPDHPAKRIKTSALELAAARRCLRCVNPIDYPSISGPSPDAYFSPYSARCAARPPPTWIVFIHRLFF